MVHASTTPRRRLHDSFTDLDRRLHLYMEHPQHRTVLGLITRARGHSLDEVDETSIQSLKSAH